MPFDFAAVRESFFDAEAVMKSMDRKERQALSKMGAFTRRRAKSSLRYRNAASLPGSPPSVHRGAFTRTKINKKTGEKKTQKASPLRELLFFGVNGKSVVIGPALFRRSNTVVQALEKGGDVVTSKPAPAPERQKAKSTAQAEAYRRKILDGSIIVPKRERIRATVHIAKRPTMVPAMEAELPKFVHLMKG